MRRTSAVCRLGHVEGLQTNGIKITNFLSGKSLTVRLGSATCHKPRSCDRRKTGMVEEDTEAQNLAMAVSALCGLVVWMSESRVTHRDGGGSLFAYFAKQHARS
ncbi:unnamed protein product [Cochlearia groenlandica]